MRTIALIGTRSHNKHTVQEMYAVFGHMQFDGSTRHVGRMKMLGKEMKENELVYRRYGKYELVNIWKHTYAWDR